MKLTESELKVLQSWTAHTWDDPRKHGLIGTCFWQMNHMADDQAKIQEAYSSLEEKINAG